MILENCEKRVTNKFKNIMKYIIKIAVMVLVICGIANGQDLKQKKVNNEKSVFSINMYPEKPQFTEGEEVVIYATIKNNSNHKDSLLNLNELEILKNTQIWNAENKDIPPPDLIACPTPMVYTVFQSGESKVIQMDVDLKAKTQGYFLEYYSAGTYNVIVDFEDLNKKHIVSDNFSFTVVKPHGSEVEELNEMLLLFSSYYISKNPQKGIDESINYLYKYPQSIYLFKVLREFGIIRQISGYRFDEQYIEDLKYYLKNNISDKKSKQFIYGIHGIIVRLKNKEEAMKYLENYRDECSDEVLKNNIDEIINRIKKNK